MNMHPASRLATRALGTALLSLAVGAAQAQQSLTVVSWGGAYTYSQVQAYHKPFSKQTGLQISSEDYNGGLAQIRGPTQA